MRNNDIYPIISETIHTENLLDGCTGLVLAVSGGSDSMTLLDYFGSVREALGFDVAVCHINHMLRVEADVESKLVEQYAAQLGFRFFEKKIDIKATCPVGKSIEEYARDIRYGFFDEIREKLGFSHIATAHNANDNVETLLLNLMRGSGADGCGIPIKRSDLVIRPLLYITKEEINENCIIRDIPYAIDMTNFESICKRNRIRNELMPLIRDIEPSADSAFSRFIYLEKKDAEYLGALAEGHMSHFVPRIDIEYAKKLEYPMLSRCIRKSFFAATGLTLDFDKTAAVTELLYEETSARRGLCGGFEAVCSYGYISYESDNSPVQTIERQRIYMGENEVLGLGTVTLADGGDIDPSLSDRLYIRSRMPGDTVKLHGHTRKLKELFIDKKIPRNERGLVYIIEADGNVIHICGIGTDDRYRVKNGLSVKN